MTPEMVRKTYGKFHPDTHRSVGDAFSQRRAGRSRSKAPRTIAKETPVTEGSQRETVMDEEPVS